MNPYLEHAYVWHDFHQTFIPALREALWVHVRPRYFVKVEDHLYIQEPDEQRRKLLGWSDVSVASQRPPTPTEPGTTVTAAPIEVSIPEVEIEHSAFLEIHDSAGLQVVTVIELLSPSNKNLGEKRDQYLAKRHQLMAKGVHLVEIDLLRGGPRMPVKDMPPCDYCVLVGRAERLWRAGLYPIHLRERLPIIRVPLRAPDPDVPVDLQAVLDRVYDSAGYGEFIYHHEPTPPMPVEDAAWAQQFLPPRSA
jgi:hypothetical protein